MGLWCTREGHWLLRAVLQLVPVHLPVSYQLGNCTPVFVRPNCRLLARWWVGYRAVSSGVCHCTTCFVRRPSPNLTKLLLVLVFFRRRTRLGASTASKASFGWIPAGPPPPAPPPPPSPPPSGFHVPPINGKSTDVLTLCGALR